MIIDTFPYFNETDLFFLRMDYLEPHVDKFVIVELDTTFSLQPHEKMFDKVYSKLPAHIKNKITYEYIELPQHHFENPGEPGSAEWKNKSRIIDVYMRDTKAQLAHSLGTSDDYVFMQDIDEFWEVKKLKRAIKLIDEKGSMGWKQDIRSGFIDWQNKDSADWVGTKGTTIGNLPKENVTADFFVSKSKSARHYSDRLVEGGWHFTLMGDEKAKSQAVAAKRETPGWVDKIGMSPDQIAKNMVSNNYNSVLKKAKMRVTEVKESYGLEPVLYALAKKYDSLWSNDLTPGKKGKK